MNEAVRAPSFPSAVSAWNGGAVRPMADHRPNVLEMSARAEAAVLSPENAGGWSGDWRLAVAARICAMNAQTEQAARYSGLISDKSVRGLSDPAVAGRDEAETSVLRFVDMVAGQPRAVTSEDIDAVKSAGVGDADLVRLCELVAFVSYQCRVMAGLSLLEDRA